MSELIVHSLSPTVFPFTALLVAVLLYWLLVILGAFTTEMLDIDLGADADDVSAGLGGKLAGFFHLGDVPLMVVVSIFAASMWAISILTNYYFNPTASLWVSIGWLGPSLVISVLLVKAALLSIAPLVRTGQASKARENLIGRTAVVITSEVNEGFGQIRIDHSGPPIVLNARVDSPPHFPRGELVRIIGYNPHNDTYVVGMNKPEKELVK